MIDTNKLLQRTTEKSNAPSLKMAMNILVIKKDLKKIDDTFKERLVLSKVRAGILREQAERLRRRSKENTLEKRKEDDGTNFDPTQDPKQRKGRGLLSLLLGGLIGGIGFLVVKAIPLFKNIFKVLRVISFPIIAIVRGTVNLIKGVGKKISPAVNDLEDRDKKDRKDIDALPGRLDALGKELEFLAGAMIFSSVFGMISTGVGAGKIKNIVNAARSKKLLTGASAVKIQRQLVAQKKVATTTAARELVEARDMVVPRTQFLGGAGFQESLVGGRTIVKKIAKEVKEESVELVEQGVKTATKGFSATKITDKNIASILDNLSAGRPLIDIKGMKKASGATTTVQGMKMFQFTEAAKQAGKLASKETPATAIIDPSQKKFIRDSRGIRQVGVEPPSFRAGVSSKQLFDALVPSGNAKMIGDEMLFKDSDGYFKNFSQLSTDRLNELKKVTTTTLQDLPDAGKTARNILLSKKGVTSTTKTATKTAAKGLTKTSLRQTLGAVPLLGDLGVMLLDIYVFKEVPARAGFKTIGSIIGSVLGGILGGLIAAATGGTGVFLIPALAILGGIGGDLLGGIIYDMVSNNYQTRTDGPFKRPPGNTSLKKSDLGRATISSGLRGSEIVKGIKDSGGIISKGMFENRGENEYLIDNNTYEVVNNKYPGLLDDINKMSDENDIIATIQQRTSYEKKKGRTKVMFIPLNQGGNSTKKSAGTIVINKSNRRESFLAMNTQTLYKR